MFKNSANNIVMLIAATCVVGLSILLTIAPLDKAIIVLNSLFAGSIFGIVFAYWRLIFATILGAPPFDRARQYALSVFIMWIAICMFVATSIFSRSTGHDPTPYTLTAAGRYLLIVAAWLQVTAPDFGMGFFAGKDRKILWTAVAIATIVAITLIIAQDNSLLAA